jgi:GNAT superfamily N-acetyltransferase
MRQPTIVPFDDTMLDAAGALLAERHRAHRMPLPALPERFEDAAVARRAVEAVWREPHANGVAALAGGRLVSYLIGAWRVDQVRGRTAWVSLAGYAHTPEIEPEMYRDCYATLAPEWVGAGCFAHYGLIVATDRALLEPWYALGFGQEQVHAIRPITAADAEISVASGDVTIRRAGPDDLGAIRGLADIVGHHQAKAPIYAAFPPEVTDHWNAAWAAFLADETAIVLIAMRGGEAIGFTLCAPAQPRDNNLLTPDHCIELRLAAVRSEERGAGIGQLLAAHSFAAAHDAGYTCCITDWRVANLHASRFWPRRGFKPAYYRLARRIDERIVWAR